MFDFSIFGISIGIVLAKINCQKKVWKISLPKIIHYFIKTLGKNVL